MEKTLLIALLSLGAAATILIVDFATDVKSIPQEASTYSKKEPQTALHLISDPEPETELAVPQNHSDTPVLSKSSNTSAAHRKSIEDTIDSIFFEQSPEDAFDFIKNLTGDSFQEHAFTYLFKQWTKLDYSSAAYHLSFLNEGPFHKPARRSFFRVLSESDPAAAGNWLLQKAQETSDQAVFVKSLTAKWMRQDIQATGEWLNELPYDQDLDPMVMQYAHYASRQDPAAAMSWAESIIDPSRRLRALKMVAKEWIRTQPTALEHYLRNTELSPEEYFSLSEMIKK